MATPTPSGFLSQKVLVSLHRAVAQTGSAFAWGAKGQGFKSPRPDHFKPGIPRGRDAYETRAGLQGRHSVCALDPVEPGIGFPSAISRLPVEVMPYPQPSYCSDSLICPFFEIILPSENCLLPAESATGRLLPVPPAFHGFLAKI